MRGFLSAYSRRLGGSGGAPFGTGGMLMRSAPSAQRAAFCGGGMAGAGSVPSLLRDHRRRLHSARARLLRSEEHNAALGGPVRLEALEDPLWWRAGGFSRRAL